MSDPVNPEHVATKEYADNNRPHIIAVYTHYSGSLIKDKYQFNFAGNKSGVYKGFLMPQTGRIKKIQVKNIFLGRHETCFYPFFGRVLYSLMEC